MEDYYCYHYEDILEIFKNIDCLLEKSELIAENIKTLLTNADNVNLINNQECSNAR